MINEGIKNKPLDRYPYMENDFKNSTITPDDFKRLKKMLPEPIEYDDFIVPDADFLQDDPLGFTALKVGGFIYANFGGSLAEPIDEHTLKKIAHINVAKYPNLKPKIRGIISSPYFTGNVLAGNGSINIYNVQNVSQRIIVAGLIYPIEI